MSSVGNVAEAPSGLHSSDSVRFKYRGQVASVPKGPP